MMEGRILFNIRALRILCKGSGFGMSMPHIEIPTVSEEIALVNIIASIALEEAALAHIINAEGEKIQRVVGTFVPEVGPELTDVVGSGSGGEVTVEDMQAVNDIVGDMMETISNIETSLHNKLRTVLSVVVVPPAPPPGP